MSSEPPLRLNQAFGDRANALGTLRLAMALAVVVSHSFVVMGIATDFTQLLGTWAVNGFFAISGYLIARSRQRLPFGRYLWHRALRLIPAYWVVLVAVAFVFAPLSTIATAETWSPASAVGYVFKNLSLWVAQPEVDATLRSVPYSMEWNAPLWTLVHEGIAYLAAGVFLSIAFVRRHSSAWLIVAMAAFMAAQLIAFGPLQGSVPLFVLHALRLGGFFAAGMLLFSLSAKIRLHWSLAVISVVALLGLQFFGVAGWLGQLFFAYIVLWLGARFPIRLGVRNDLSYGIYIWAFPIQQLLVVTGVAQQAGVYGSALIAIAVTLPIAWLSWRLIERPALSLKSVHFRWARSQDSAATPV